MATSVSFTPDIYNVTWDAVSPAEVTFGLRCPGSGSYAATAYRVFQASGAYAYGPGDELAYPFRAGERYFSIDSTGAIAYTAPNLPMTATAVGSTAVRVTFSSLNLSGALFGGGRNEVFAWRLTDTGDTRLLVAGRLTVSLLNPYRLPSQSTGVFITGTTMTSSEC